jgi:signal transduction histidine kinase
MKPAIERLACGVLTVDSSGVVRYANDTLAAMLGREVGEIEGEHVDRLLPAASRIFFSTHVFPLLRVQASAEEIYLPMLAPDGTDLPMLLNGRARESDAGFVADLILVPMRQRNALESELIAARNTAQEAVAAKDRFLSIVSHELRSPLTGIIGYAELLLREKRGKLVDEQRKYVERIREAADYQASLIADILDVAGSGELRDLESRQLALEEVLARAESVLIVRAEAEGRALERHPRPARGVVHGDPRALQQILLNLGTNALKYGAKGSPVQIVVDHDGQRVRLSVIDVGEGIPPEELTRIFEPFVRLVAPSGREAPKGIGLGLSISRDLARAMGGDITATSVLGEGSTFVLELPEGLGSSPLAR